MAKVDNLLALWLLSSDRRPWITGQIINSEGGCIRLLLFNLKINLIISNKNQNL